MIQDQVAMGSRTWTKPKCAAIATRKSTRQTSHTAIVGALPELHISFPNEFTWSNQDAVAIARLFKAAGCDVIDVSSGQTTRQAKPVYGRMYQTPFADRVRNEVDILTIAVGAISEADHANSIIAAGKRRPAGRKCARFANQSRTRVPASITSSSGDARGSARRGINSAAFSCARTNGGWTVASIVRAVSAALVPGLTGSGSIRKLTSS